MKLVILVVVWFWFGWGDVEGMVVVDRYRWMACRGGSNVMYSKPDSLLCRLIDDILNKNEFWDGWFTALYT